MSNCKHYTARVVKNYGTPIDFEQMCLIGNNPTKCNECSYREEKPTEKDEYFELTNKQAEEMFLDIQADEAIEEQKEAIYTDEP